jgi:hypothetical protein
MMIVSAIAHSVAIVAIVIVPWLSARGRRRRSWKSARPSARLDTGMTALSPAVRRRAESELPKPTRDAASRADAGDGRADHQADAKPAAQASPRRSGAALDRRDRARAVKVRRIDVERGGLSTGAWRRQQPERVNFCDPQYSGRWCR